MWGNLTGWIISAFVGAGMLAMLYWVATPPGRTAPTNSSKLIIAYSEVTLPVPADSIVAPGVKDCDAGDSYRKAIDDFLLTPDLYEKFQHGGQMKIKEKELSAVADVLAGRDCRNCTLFRKTLPKVVNYDNVVQSVDALRDTGNICNTLGLLYTNEKYDKNLKPEKAVKLWEAAFVLGWHMYDERASWTEAREGIELMTGAAAAMHTFYQKNGQSDKAAKMQAFVDGESALSPKLIEAFKIIGNVDESYGGKYAGDIFKIAESPTADHMFRAEAIKHLGHYRYNALTSGDQLWAKKVLKNMVEDDKLPPNVKAAANAAHDLTLQQHNMVGGAS